MLYTRALFVATRHSRWLYCITLASYVTLYAYDVIIASSLHHHYIIHTLLDYLAKLQSRNSSAMSDVGMARRGFTKAALTAMWAWQGAGPEEGTTRAVWRVLLMKCSQALKLAQLGGRNSADRVYNGISRCGQSAHSAFNPLRMPTTGTEQKAYSVDHGLNNPPPLPPPHPHRSGSSRPVPSSTGWVGAVQATARGTSHLRAAQHRSRERGTAEHRTQ